MPDLERDVRFLKVYSIVLTTVVVCFLAFDLLKKDQPRFSEIDVERINIIEANGDLRLVISNQERQHPGILNGRIVPRKGPRGAGLIFFNNIGDETGGLTYQTDEKWGHYGGMAFDKLNHDQTIAIQHAEDKEGNHQVGLRVWQRPKNTVWESVEALKKIEKIADPQKREAALQEARAKGVIHSTRVFLGKRKDNTAELVLSDSLSRPRIRLKVSESGIPLMEFLDEKGNVSHRFPSPRRNL